MRKGLAILAFVLCASNAGHAQPPLSVEWEQPLVTPTEAQAYTYTYFLDNLSGVILQAVVCGLRNNITVCAAPLPIPSVGIHDLYLKVSNSYGTSDPSPVLRFRYPLVPEAPRNLRIIRSE